MIFIDTWAWVALAIPEDQHHTQAAAIYRRLIQSREPMVTSDYVLGETKLRSVFLGIDIGVNTVYILSMSLTSSWKETAKGKGVTLGLVTVFFNN